MVHLLRRSEQGTARMNGTSPAAENAMICTASCRLSIRCRENSLRDCVMHLQSPVFRKWFVHVNKYAARRCVLEVSTSRNSPTLSETRETSGPRACIAEATTQLLPTSSILTGYREKQRQIVYLNTELPGSVVIRAENEWHGSHKQRYQYGRPAHYGDDSRV